MTVLVVHGIGNHQGPRTRHQAAERLADIWRPALAAGYHDAGLGHLPVPDLWVAYYANRLLPGEAQGASDIASLTEDEAAIAWAWAVAAGVPRPAEAQGLATVPLRQALDWLARRNGKLAVQLARAAVTFAREVHRYFSNPVARAASREAVADEMRRHAPTVLIAHSLGSVVAYEALHAYPDLRVECFLTLGSPLGLAGGVFERLEPAPEYGLGSRPTGADTWVDLADVGDLVAVPRHLGDRFPVDRHEDCRIGSLDFHTLTSYLSCGLIAAAVAPYAETPARGTMDRAVVEDGRA
ncbi:hypothetical protein [Streptomyces scopuliridis]|uniref:Serine peptidase n=1 Tax=Streptomyces scopuliridis RB72 TaxID=1440053 RepID=A0A2T7TEX7_9ACTN|nr:hypothetical protein [Streptomyces scopuliridis]PVE13648.1 hypothetical protein Y717_14550 [Streptomyces scopuliridis RB72]